MQSEAFTFGKWSYSEDGLNHQMTTTIMYDLHVLYAGVHDEVL